jgi:hypothetical protein
MLHGSRCYTGRFLQKGGRRPQPIHGQPDAVLSEASSQKFAEKTKFHKVLVKKVPLAAGGKKNLRFLEFCVINKPGKKFNTYIDG